MRSLAIHYFIILFCTCIQLKRAYRSHHRVYQVINKHVSIVRMSNPYNAIDVDIESSLNEIKNRLYDLLLDSTTFDESSIKSCVKQLERQASKISDGSIPELKFPSLWDNISGDWELLYSNVIKSSKPDRSGIKTVIQRIIFDKYETKHPTWDALTASSSPRCIYNITSAKNNHQINHILLFNDNPLLSKITLFHDVEITSNSQPAQIQIYLKSANVNDNINIPLILLPTNQLAPKEFISSIPWPLSEAVDIISKLMLQSVTYDVSYCDNDLRISRGSYGELRIFRRFYGNADY